MTILHAQQKREATKAMIAQAKQDLLNMVRRLDATGLHNFTYSNGRGEELLVLDGTFKVRGTYGLIPSGAWTLDEAEVVASVLPEFLAAYAKHEDDELQRWQRLVATVDRAVNDDVPF